MNSPRYPIYIISKGRASIKGTARFMQEDGLKFVLVIEPQEYDEYAAFFPPDCLRVLPFSNLGLGSTPARNWCWEDAKAQGYDWHWLFDDNIVCMYRLNKGKRIQCSAKVALVVAEDFTDRFANVGLSGFNYYMFVTDGTQKPFFYNTHVYSALLIKNDLPFRWRLRYNEDTDLCLQILSSGLCTIALNAFSAAKKATMTTKGGNTEELYINDGRLKMARSLESLWPQYVEVKWRYGRPQHYVDWKKHFTHPLRRKLVGEAAPPSKVYDITLRQVEPIKSPELRAFYEKNK